MADHADAPYEKEDVGVLADAPIDGVRLHGPLPETDRTQVDGITTKVPKETVVSFGRRGGLRQAIGKRRRAYADTA